MYSCVCVVCVHVCILALRAYVYSNTCRDDYWSSNIQWTLDHEIDDLDLDLTFAVETDVFGAATEMELLEGGKNITVSDNNKVK